MFVLFAFRGDFMAHITGTATVTVHIPDDLLNLRQKIDHTVTSAMEGQVRALASEIMREAVAKDAAMRGGGAYYTPTEELADAIVITGGGKHLHIEMDGSRMSASPPVIGEDGRIVQWGVHTSVYGEAKNDMMPLWLNDGAKGLVSHVGSEYFEYAWARIQAQVPEKLAAALSALGFEVTIS